jgi:hypothetical protein
MESFLLVFGAVAVGCVALILRKLRSENRELQAEAAERDAREKAHVARMQERVAAVQREHERMKAPDPKIRTGFE